PPERGAIVFFQDPTDAQGWMVKRVVGLPGEIVAVFGGRVFINGQPLQEPYARGPTPGMGLWKVPDDGVFVLGDNREVSDDSRTFGPIEMSLIEGKIGWRIWPLSRWGRVE
ncbi:MAG: signal peptidase I, partial [Armatimonadetes bacterium]|nr:signal peptidase I [Armatimonadota bacterium]MDW8122312.1 signal peptidase I [Armatimonadota bacterium]